MINIINKININYIIISILFLVASILFLKDNNIKKSLKKSYIITYIMLTIVGTVYIKNILNSIFKLELASVDLYILSILISTIIILITINKKINLSNKILNKTLYLISTLILVLNVILLIGIKTNYFITEISTIIKLMNLNFIAFIVYLYLVPSVYIIKSILIGLLKKKNKYIIKGIDCSIILEDNDKENRKKNYELLKKDINAKLTNGYTLEETKTLKNIIEKLNIKTINDLNLDINKLNKITKEEYTLLKSFMTTHNI
ncbi:MAG: hypothetical protein IJI49_01490 [Bacilli bacterium]|nr:hypothetical protein [Bacilli bacterium]